MSQIPEFLDHPLTEDEYISGSVKDYYELLKPGVMSLVVYTGFIGLLIAPGYLHPVLSMIVVLCIALGSGASGALNMWLERDRDALMTRTAKRPLPQKKISASSALAFGMILAVVSITLLGMATNWLSAGMLAFSIFFYVVIYTIWLKPRTPQNIVIGGAAGAFPPVIGWLAVTGSFDWPPLVLFMIVFFWTPPHFWALALYKNKDYKKANIPMLPLTHGLIATRNQIFMYTLLLWPLVLLPYLMGFAGQVYLWIAVIVQLGFFISAFRVWLERDQFKFAKIMFTYSILYLFVLFSGFIVERF